MSYCSFGQNFWHLPITPRQKAKVLTMVSKVLRIWLLPPHLFPLSLQTLSPVTPGNSHHLPLLRAPPCLKLCRRVDKALAWNQVGLGLILGPLLTACVTRSDSLHFSGLPVPHL